MSELVGNDHGGGLDLFLSVVALTLSGLWFVGSGSESWLILAAQWMLFIGSATWVVVAAGKRFLKWMSGMLVTGMSN